MVFRAAGRAAAPMTAVAVVCPAYLAIEPGGADAAPVACRLAIRAKPGARASSVEAMDGDCVEVRVGAPPVEGRANAELVDFIAGVLGRAARGVRLGRGATNRSKVVEFDYAGDAAAEVPRALHGSMAPAGRR
jgi:uncharacterized protein (TIGR00251 family)